MTSAITEHRFQSARHETFYLESGPEGGPVIIFVHGWPELSHSWRHQLPYVAALGYRAIAPDMRGYGKSSVYPRHEDYQLEEIVADMIDLLDHLDARQAVFVGHDWGAPVVWTMAQQHPNRVAGVAALCVPYQPETFGAETSTDLVDRTVYPIDQYPVGQWDYHFFYRENFDLARKGFEANVRNTVRIMFRAGKPEGRGKPVATASIRARGGWFGPDGAAAPDVPRDPLVLSQEDEDVYVEALERNGFFGPDSWYMNHRANKAFAERAKDARRLKMPVLFFHATYDYVCETMVSRLPEPMRANTDDLTEVIVQSGHWMAQEKPDEVNAGLKSWLAQKLPNLVR